MTQVDFYIIKDESDEGRMKLACRIAEKAYKRNQHVYLHTDADETAARLDELLWTFSQSSFVPHSIYNESASARRQEPVLIGSGAEPAGERWDVLINLAATVPEFFSRYERVAEVVDGNSARRSDGRDRFRYYRDRGYKLNTHDID